MVQIEDRICGCLRRFLDNTGRTEVPFDTGSNLVGDLGLNSDEGVDFVLDLCDEFGIDLPKDFNPVAHESDRRGRKVAELVSAVRSLVEGKGG